MPSNHPSTSEERRIRELERERDRLRSQTDALAGLLRERNQLSGRVERLDRALIGERERNAQLRFQRDRYRHQAASLRARRWWRLGAAIAAARRSPAKLLSLPITLLRILLGPAAKPDVPSPVPAGEAAGEAVEATSAQLRSPTETRPSAHLESRFLLPPRARAVTDLKVAAVVDTFTEACLAPDCDLITFRPDTWRSALEAERPHLLFVESAWKGNGGSWEFQVGSYTYPASVGLPHLTELVEWCRAHDVPTVFWNKEDPVHFQKFAEAARLFDVVLTTDADRIPAYQALDGLRAEVVAALPFAAQPALHHPTHELADRDPRPVFGGTYYRNRHPERREQLEHLLDGAREFDLVIFDRTHGQESESVGFPDRFLPHVQGGVPYEEMVRIYREHRLFLNTNSVIASPTMFSRRVFELLACGTPVVSTPSLGVEELFGGTIPIVDTEPAARAAIEQLLTDDGLWHERSAAGIRQVLAEHTYQHRLARVAAFAGYTLTPYADRQATVLLLDDEEDRTHGLCLQLAAENSELTVAVGTASPERFAELPVTVVRQDAKQQPGARWRQLADRVTSPFVVPAHPLTSPLALTDLVLGLVLTSADAAGFDPANPAWRHVDRVDNTAVALRRELVLEHGWDVDPAGADRVGEILAAAGIRPFNLGAVPTGVGAPTVAAG
ncbi:MAG: glycosyltransferase [Nitriliruptoraceae bacterium]